MSSESTFDRFISAKLGELQEKSYRDKLTDPLEYLDQKDQLSRAEILKRQEEEDEEEVARLMSLQNSSRQGESDESIDEEDPEQPGDSTALPSTSSFQPSSSNSLYNSMKKQVNSKPKDLLLGVVVKKPKLTQPKPLAGLVADYGSSSGEE